MNNIKLMLQILWECLTFTSITDLPRDLEILHGIIAWIGLIIFSLGLIKIINI